MFDSLFSNRGLSLDRLRSFLEMAEAGGIAKAAPGDVVRQSQISRQIRELEEFFGTELTQRRGKNIILTATGRRLADLVRWQLQGLEDFRREQEGLQKVFTIGAGGSTLEWLVTPRLPRLPRMSQALAGAQLRTDMLPSRALVEAVQEGRVDLAVVRRDAIPEASRPNCHPVTDLSFHLCIPRKLLPPGTSAEVATEPHRWRELPFAAGRDGGQLDGAIRTAMATAGANFRPCFECSSLTQVRQLLLRENCAAVLPNIALAGLDEKRILIVPFSPLGNYDRPLVLHWNPRQMERRGVGSDQLRSITALLAGS